MIDERYQTGGALTILGTVATWIIDNPSEFVTMSVAILGFVIMLYKYLDEREERKQRMAIESAAHAAAMEKLALEQEKLRRELSNLD